MFDSIRETCYVYIWYYAFLFLNKTVYVVCNTVFTSFDILLLTFWHYCKICRFPKLTVWKEYFTILMWFFLFCLNGKCRLGKFQVFFYINFTVWTVSIFIITLRLYDLSSKLYHYTVYFLLKTTKYFQCINVMFNPCACMCDLIIHCIIFQVKLALLTLWICQ